MMNQDALTLELLVKTGNTSALQLLNGEEIVFEKALVDKMQDRHMAEAAIYHGINSMWEQAEGGIHEDLMSQWFSIPQIAEYFKAEPSVEMLHNLLDVLHAGTNANMETYAQITAVTVFGVPHVAQAFKDKMNAIGMKEKLTKFVEAGYNMLFCPESLDNRRVEHFSGILEGWTDLVDPETIVDNALMDWKEHSDMDDEGYFRQDYNKKFAYEAIPVMINMTSRAYVSQRAKAHLADSDYQTLVKDGLLDKVAAKKGAPTGKFGKAMATFEADRSPYYFDVKPLAEALGKKGSEFIGRKMGEWLEQGRVRHINAILEYEKKQGRIYDTAVAREGLTAAIGKACAKADTGRLIHALKLPEDVVDLEAPGLESFATAYRLTKQAEGNTLAPLMEY
ncbi:MAG: hypothetical protein KKG59_01260 [Nanoarchaeota archaeon]|nr:hypothetical protein [Nanoarchaeota archaeon]